MSNLFKTNLAHGESVLRASNAETLQTSSYRDDPIAKQLLIKIGSVHSYKLQRQLAIKLGEPNFDPQKTYDELLPLIKDSVETPPSTLGSGERNNFQRMVNGTEPSFLDQHRFTIDEDDKKQGRGIKRIYPTFFDKAGFFKQLHDSTQFLRQIPIKRKKIEKKKKKRKLDDNKEKEEEEEEDEMGNLVLMLRRKIKMKKLHAVVDNKIGLNPLPPPPLEKEDYMGDFKHMIGREKEDKSLDHMGDFQNMITREQRKTPRKDGSEYMSDFKNMMARDRKETVNAMDYMSDFQNMVTKDQRGASKENSEDIMNDVTMFEPSTRDKIIEVTHDKAERKRKRYDPQALIDHKNFIIKNREKRRKEEEEKKKDEEMRKKVQATFKLHREERTKKAKLKIRQEMEDRKQKEEETTAKVVDEKLKREALKRESIKPLSDKEIERLSVDELIKYYRDQKGAGLKRKKVTNDDEQDEDFQAMIAHQMVREKRYRHLQLARLREELKDDVRGGNLEKEMDDVNEYFHDTMSEKAKKVKDLYRKSKRNMTHEIEEHLHKLHENLYHQRRHAHNIMSYMGNLDSHTPHYKKFKSWVSELPVTDKMKKIKMAIENMNVRQFNDNMKGPIYGNRELSPLIAPNDPEGGRIRGDMHVLKVKANLLKLIKKSSPHYEEYKAALLDPSLKFDLAEIVNSILKDKRTNIDSELRKSIEDSNDLDEFFNPDRLNHFDPSELGGLVKDLEHEWKENQIEKMRHKYLNGPMSMNTLYGLKKILEKELIQIRQRDPHLYEKLSEDISGSPSEVVVENGWDKPLLGMMHMENPTGKLNIRKNEDDENDQSIVRYEPHDAHATHVQTLSNSKTFDHHRHPQHTHHGVRVRQNISQHTLLDIMKMMNKVLRPDDENHEFLYKVLNSLHHDSFKHKKMAAKLHGLSLPHDGETMFHHLFAGSNLNSLYENPIQDDDPLGTHNLLKTPKRHPRKIVIRNNHLATHQVKGKKGILHYVKTSKKRRGGAIFGQTMNMLGGAALSLPWWTYPLAGYGATNWADKMTEPTPGYAPSYTHQTVSGLKNLVSTSLSKLGEFTVDGLEYAGFTPPWVKPVYNTLTWMASHLTETFSISGLFAMYMFGGKLLKILPYIPAGFNELKKLLVGVTKGISSLKDSEKKLQSDKDNPENLHDEKDPNFEQMLGGRPVNSRRMTSRALKAAGYDPRMTNFVHDKVMGRHSAQYPGMSNDHFYNRMMPRMMQGYPPFQSMSPQMGDQGMQQQQFWNNLHQHQLMKTLSHHNLTYSAAPKPKVLKMSHTVDPVNWQDGLMITLSNNHQGELNDAGIHFLSPYSVSYKGQQYNLRELSTKHKRDLNHSELKLIDQISRIFERDNKGMWLAALPANQNFYKSKRDIPHTSDDRGFLGKMFKPKNNRWDQFNDDKFTEENLDSMISTGSSNAFKTIPPSDWYKRHASLELPHRRIALKDNIRKSYNPSGVVEERANKVALDRLHENYSDELDRYRAMSARIESTNEQDDENSVQSFRSLKHPKHLQEEFNLLDESIQDYQSKNARSGDERYTLNNDLNKARNRVQDNVKAYERLIPERRKLFDENAQETPRYPRQSDKYEDVKTYSDDSDDETGGVLVAPAYTRAHNHIVMHVEPHKWHKMSIGRSVGGSIHSTFPMWDSDIEIRGLPEDKLVVNKDKNRFKIVRPIPENLFSHHDEKPNEKNLTSSIRRRNDNRINPKFNPNVTKLIGRMPLSTPTNLNSDGNFKRHYKLFGLPRIIDSDFKKNFHSSSTLTVKNDENLSTFLSDRDPFIHKSLQSKDSMQPLYSFTHMPEKYI